MYLFLFLILLLTREVRVLFFFPIGVDIKSLVNRPTSNEELEILRSVLFPTFPWRFLIFPLRPGVLFTLLELLFEALDAILFLCVSEKNVTY